jgi:prepilin-type N-terminal cleavage/methylation domain-containing protein
MKFVYSKKSRQQGFTLIEMIVSLGIFAVVAVIAAGALLKVLDANRKSINLKNATNNLNFALESMSREMRVGGNYYCDGSSNAGSGSISSGAKLTPNSCEVSNGPWLLAFDSSKISGTRSDGSNCHLKYAYRFNIVSPQQATLQKGKETSCDAGIPSSSFSDVTSSIIKFTSYILTVDNTPKKQPYIFLFFKGSTGLKEKDKVDFAIQTSISQRIK